MHQSGWLTLCHWRAFPRGAHAAVIAPGASGWFRSAAALAASAVAVLSVLAAQTPQSAWVNCGLGWTLLTLAWIDASLPDLLTLPLVLAGLGVTVATAAAAFGLLWLHGPAWSPT